MDATDLYWPAKARTLAEMASRAVAVVAAWAASLGIAGMPAPAAAQTIRQAVAERIEYRTETGDYFDEAPIILARGSDDCDGHAILGAALGAAAGHPARIVGLSLDGVQPQHVRAEIGDGYAWYSADSTGLDRPAILHTPVANLARPVGGFFDRIGDGLSAFGEAVGDFGHWLNNGTVLSDIARFVMDPDVWAAVAVIAGCATVTGGLGAVACAKLDASYLAWGLIAAESWSTIGPGRWKELSESQRADRLEEARRALGDEEMIARMAAAERIAMSRDPEVAMMRDPQIAHDALGYVNQNGRPDTRQALFHRLMWRPGGASDAQASAMVLRLLGGMGLATIRQDAEQAFGWALRQSEDRLQVRVEAELDRYQHNAEIQRRWDNCPPIPDYAREWLQATYGAQWERVWCEADRQTRREFLARIKPNCIVPGQVRERLGIQRDAYCAASKEQQAAWDAQADAAIDRNWNPEPLPDGVRAMGIAEDAWHAASRAQQIEWQLAAIDRGVALPPNGLTPDQLAAVRRFNPIQKSAPSVGGGGSGGGVLAFGGLAAALLYALRG